MKTNKQFYALYAMSLVALTVVNRATASSPVFTTDMGLSKTNPGVNIVKRSEALFASKKTEALRQLDSKIQNLQTRLQAASISQQLKTIAQMAIQRAKALGESAINNAKSSAALDSAIANAKNLVEKAKSAVERAKSGLLDLQKSARNLG